MLIRIATFAMIFLAVAEPHLANYRKDAERILRTWYGAADQREPSERFRLW